MFGMSPALTLGVVLVLLGAIFLLVAIIGSMQGTVAVRVESQVRKITGALGGVLLLLGILISVLGPVLVPASGNLPPTSTSMTTPAPPTTELSGITPTPSTPSTPTVTVVPSPSGPKQTLNTFCNAMKIGGDRSLAVAQFTARGLQFFDPRNRKPYTSCINDQLTVLTDMTAQGHLVVVTTDDATYSIDLTLRREGNSWKIDSWMSHKE